MKPHPDAELLKELFPSIRVYQELATKHGVPDIFQDNGGKILQVCLILGLTVIPSREGNDAYDESGKEYELKTVNLLRTNQFTTHHHLNPIILAKYRLVDWIFTTYEGIELKEIYLLTPAKMEHWYKKWETTLSVRGGHLNNPKVPLSYVRTYGEKLYSSLGEPLEESLEESLKK